MSFDPSAPATRAPAGAVRAVDVAAIDAALRRLARAPQPPWLHGEVARRMGERLAIVKLQPDALVDWWSFLGAGDEVLARAYPRARRLLVEPTPALQARSSEAQQAPWWSARRWQRSSEVLGEVQVPEDRAQLVWANMMLHAARDPAAVMAQWQRALAVGGFVMFSCFGPDTLKELRALYRALDWPPAHADFVDMHDLGDMMLHAGFADPVMDQEQIRLSWASGDALLAELRGLGANAALDRMPALRTPRWRARLVEALAALRGADGRLHLTFEIVYGHAFKAAPRVRGSAQTVVPLEEMRAIARSRRR